MLHVEARSIHGLLLISSSPRLVWPLYTRDESSTIRERGAGAIIAVNALQVALHQRETSWLAARFRCTIFSPPSSRFFVTFAKPTNVAREWRKAVAPFPQDARQTCRKEKKEMENDWSIRRCSDEGLVPEIVLFGDLSFSLGQPVRCPRQRALSHHGQSRLHSPTVEAYRSDPRGYVHCLQRCPAVRQSSQT